LAALVFLDLPDFRDDSIYDHGFLTRPVSLGLPVNRLGI
jgi:hypothetical protein